MEKLDIEEDKNKNNLNNTDIIKSISKINEKISNYIPKKIERKEQVKSCIFNKIVETIISYKIFPFLSLKEIKQIGKVNIHFHNSFIRYYEYIVYSLIEKYNIDISQLSNNEGNFNLNCYFSQKNDKGHFIKIGLNNLEHICLFSYFDWTWKNDTKYWEPVECQESLLYPNFNNNNNKIKIYHLKTVCWIDTSLEMSHIFQGKYKIFLRHCVCYINQILSMKMTIFLDGENIYEKLYPLETQIQRCKKAHLRENNGQKGEMTRLHRPFFNPRIRGGIRGNINRNNFVGQNDGKFKLFDEFIMEINIPNDNNIKENEGHIIKIAFNHNNNDWKKEWLIDGIILKKINE